VAKSTPPPRGPQLELAGALCVAFVNTAGAGPKNRQQGVASYADLVTWGQQAGVLSPLDADRLRRVAGDRPGEAEATFAKAAKLRYDLARVASRRGSSPTEWSRRVPPRAPAIDAEFAAHRLPRELTRHLVASATSQDAGRRISSAAWSTSGSAQRPSAG